MLCNISQNAMGQTLVGGGGYPARSRQGGCTLPGPAGGGGCTLPGPARGGTLLGGTKVGSPPARSGGVPCWGGNKVGYPPARSGRGGYPVRTTEGAHTTRRAVCLLRSRRRTFLSSIRKSEDANFGFLT